MTPQALFQIANPLALLGWIALAASPLAPRIVDRVAGYAIPALLSVGYTAIILGHWWSTEGGYGSLPDVMTLLSHPWAALAGWVHYLAFDLFVGTWIARTAREEGIRHLLVLPILVLTFLFGPIGLLTFLTLRISRSAAPNVPEA